MIASPTETASLVADHDYWRGAWLEHERGMPYKEWHHFVVFGGEWTLLFNLNLDGHGAGRVIVVLDRAGWHGAVTSCRAPQLRPGRLDADFGPAGMRWRGDRFEIWQRGKGACFEIELLPASIPSISHNIRLGAGAQVSWCLVPRLVASGWLEHDGVRLSFADRVAYHDHNWGRFAWGGDFSWEWGCAVPDDPELPWTLIFARMNDRRRHRTTATSMFLLEHGRHLRYFRNAEASIATDGVADSRPAGRVPAAAALLLPDEDREMPRWLRLAAARGEDALHGEVEVVRHGQILVPSETNPRGIVRLNEATTRVRVHGHCAGRVVEWRGAGLVEVTCG